MQQVPSAVRYPPPPVPFRSPDELLDILDQVFFDILIQNHGFQGSLGLGLSELPPVVSGATRVGQGLALVLLECLSTGFFENLDEKLPLFSCGFVFRKKKIRQGTNYFLAKYILIRNVGKTRRIY